MAPALSTAQTQVLHSCTDLIGEYVGDVQTRGRQKQGKACVAEVAQRTAGHTPLAEMAGDGKQMVICLFGVSVRPDGFRDVKQYERERILQRDKTFGRGQSVLQTCKALKL